VDEYWFESLADFGNPILVGSDFRVLSVEAYIQAVGRFNLPAAAAVSAVLFVPALLLFIVQRRIHRRAKYTTVGGRGGDIAPPPLPRAVRIVVLAVMTAVSIGLIATYVSIVLGGFIRAWGADWSFTLEHWEFTVLRADDLWNSFRFAGTAAICTAIFGVVAAWVIHRGRVRGLRLLDALAIFPAAIPGTMVGISWIIVFNEPPLILTGTGIILVMVMMLRTLPVGYRTAVGSLQQISPNLEEAAADMGAGRLETFTRVTAPLLTGAATTAFIFSFLNSINTLSAVIFLISPGRHLASPTIVGLAEFGFWGEATALAGALMAVTFAGLAAFYLLGGRKRRLFDL
jgi:iron(III) transport system permease protein